MGSTLVYFSVLPAYAGMILTLLVLCLNYQVLPAYAGMILIGNSLRSKELCFTRIRGDDPKTSFIKY